MLEKTPDLPIRSSVVSMKGYFNELAVRALELAREMPLADAIEKVCQKVQTRQAVMDRCERILIIIGKTTDKERL